MVAGGWGRMGAGKAELCCSDSHMFILQLALGKSLHLVVASYMKEENLRPDMNVFVCLLVSQVISMMN